MQFPCVKVVILLRIARGALQVTPFILRRTKEAVLQDLPPKIIQDVLCEPSPLQQALLEAFVQSAAGQQLSGPASTCGSASTAADQAPHIFQVGHSWASACC